MERDPDKAEEKVSISLGSSVDLEPVSAVGSAFPPGLQRGIDLCLVCP